MSAKFYVKDTNGTDLSIDGKTKFKIYTGSDAYAFLQTEEGKNKFFFKTISSDGDKIAIECTEEQYLVFEREKRRHRYLKFIETEKGYGKVSLDYLLGLDDNDVSIIETIEDETVNIEDMCYKRELYSRIHEALESLTKDEFDLILALFILKKPMTESEYAEKKGVTQKAINKKKHRILKKIKKFL